MNGLASFVWALAGIVLYVQDKSSDYLLFFRMKTAQLFQNTLTLSYPPPMITTIITNYHTVTDTVIIPTVSTVTSTYSGGASALILTVPTPSPSSAVTPLHMVDQPSWLCTCYQVLIQIIFSSTLWVSLGFFIVTLLVGFGLLNLIQVLTSIRRKSCDNARLRALQVYLSERDKALEGALKRYDLHSNRGTEEARHDCRLDINEDLDAAAWRFRETLKDIDRLPRPANPFENQRVDSAHLAVIEGLKDMKEQVTTYDEYCYHGLESTIVSLWQNIATLLTQLVHGFWRTVVPFLILSGYFSFKYCLWGLVTVTLAMAFSAAMAFYFLTINVLDPTVETFFDQCRKWLTAPPQENILSTSETNAESGKKCQSAQQRRKNAKQRPQPNLPMTPQQLLLIPNHFSVPYTRYIEIPQDRFEDLLNKEAQLQYKQKTKNDPFSILNRLQTQLDRERKEKEELRVQLYQERRGRNADARKFARQQLESRSKKCLTGVTESENREDQALAAPVNKQFEEAAQQAAARIKELEKLVSGHEERALQNATKANEHQSRTSELQARIEQERALKEAAERSAKSTQADLEAEVAAHDKLKSVAGEEAAAHSKLKAEVEGAHAEFSAMRTRLDGAVAAHDNLKAQAEGAEAVFKGMQQKVGELEAGQQLQAAMQERISQLEQQLHAATSNVAGPQQAPGEDDFVQAAAKAAAIADAEFPAPASVDDSQPEPSMDYTLEASPKQNAAVQRDTFGEARPQAQAQPVAPLAAPQSSAHRWASQPAYVPAAPPSTSTNQAAAVGRDAMVSLASRSPSELPVDENGKVVCPVFVPRLSAPVYALKSSTSPEHASSAGRFANAALSTQSSSSISAPVSMPAPRPIAPKPLASYTPSSMSYGGYTPYRPSYTPTMPSYISNPPNPRHPESHRKLQTSLHQMMRNVTSKQDDDSDSEPESEEDGGIENALDAEPKTQEDLDSDLEADFEDVNLEPTPDEHGKSSTNNEDKQEEEKEESDASEQRGASKESSTDEASGSGEEDSSQTPDQGTVVVNLGQQPSENRTSVVEAIGKRKRDGGGGGGGDDDDDDDDDDEEEASSMEEWRNWKINAMPGNNGNTSSVFGTGQDDQQDPSSSTYPVSTKLPRITDVKLSSIVSNGRDGDYVHDMPFLSDEREYSRAYRRHTFDLLMNTKRTKYGCRDLNCKLEEVAHDCISAKLERRHREAEESERQEAIGNKPDNKRAEATEVIDL